MHEKRFPVPTAVLVLAAAIAGVAPQVARGESLGIGRIEVGGRGAVRTPVRPGATVGLHGSSMARSPDGATLYVADTDADAVVAIALADFEVVGRHAVGDGPEQVAVLPDGRVLVTMRNDGTVAALAPRTLRVLGRARVGVEPWGLALSPDGRRAYVSSSQSETLTALDTASLRTLWTVELPDAEPRGVAVAPDGHKAYVVHLRSPRVSVVNLDEGRLDSRLALPGGSAPARRGFSGRFPMRHGFESGLVNQFAFSNGVSGVPNRALAAVVSSDGSRLFVPFDLKSAGGEIPIGQRSGSYGAGVSSPIVASLASIPLDGSDAPATLTVLANLLDPTDVQIDETGRNLIVTGAGPHASMFDVSNAGRPHSERAIPVQYAESIASFGGEILAFDPVLFQLRKYDAARLGQAATATLQTSDDPFPADIAAGRRFFHQRAGQVSETALACQSCHPDGRQDGITWNIDLGPRQTPILAGHLADTAPYHWLGSAATIDASIRETIARLGGSGLGDAEVAQITRFLVDGLTPVPNPHAGRPLTAEQERGKALFASADLGCASCHQPDNGFTDGAQRVLGRGPDAGESAALRRFDTPSLRDLRASAPYLHDGSAPDLESVLVAFNHDDRMGRSRHLPSRDMSALVAYLETL